MACEYCRYSIGHDYRCPNFEEIKSNHFCNICNEDIYYGEKYIINSNNEYAHYDCISYGYDMADFLGYEIKEMENECG